MGRTYRTASAGGGFLWRYCRKMSFITRVVIKNYKSIAGCDVSLAPLQFLVGRNGAGKSNFLDALAFVRDAIADNLEHAFNVRQGLNQVRRRSGGHPQNFGIRLEFNLPDGKGTKGSFAFELTSKKGQAFHIKEEMAELLTPGLPLKSYHIKNGKIDSPYAGKNMPPVVRDRLYLQNIGGHDEYRLLFDALRTMGIYNINPREMVRPLPPEIKTLLKEDGSNIATILSVLTPESKEVIQGYMKKIVPFVSDFNSANMGSAWKYVEFSQEVKSQKHPWRFFPVNMSDGTLRALGILVALLQKQKGDSNSFPALVGIEEPETALHARASGALLDALEKASQTRQVIVTTHSTEILDNKIITPDKILPVALFDSETCINNIDKASKEMLEQHLTTAGELLRQDILRPDIFSRNKNFPLFCSS